jgi:hypothetical protein
MFLYAILVMDNLFHQLSLAAMRAELDPRVFPDGLHQACVSKLGYATSVPRTNLA